MDRPKTGFGVPLATWLRGPLRECAEELLEEGRLRQEGFLDPAPIRRKWKVHLAGKHSWEYDLWDVLTFQAWLEAHGTGGGLPAGIRAAAEHRGALAT